MKYNPIHANTTIEQYEIKTAIIPAIPSSFCLLLQTNKLEETKR